MTAREAHYSITEDPLMLSWKRNVAWAGAVVLGIAGGDAAAQLPAPQVQLLPPVAVSSLPQTTPAGTLAIDEVVRVVIERNPTIAQMSAAWEAAAAKYPQMTSADDPMFSTMVAPSSFSSNTVEPGYRIELSQKILWPGKRNLRGDVARAEAGAAAEDLAETRLQLVEMARIAFADYCLVYRAIEVNNEAARLLTEFRENAETRFRTGQIPQQDILQADVELNKQRERGLTLQRMRRVAIARLNTLMHQEPGVPLPPPPNKLSYGAPLRPVSDLTHTALAGRPDLRALEARITSERASLGLATKDYWPDVEVAAAYDTIMGNGAMRDLAPQVGVKLNLPIRTHKRHAAVAEAQAKIAQRSAELAAKIDQVKFQVHEAYEQVVESEQVQRLYETKILPQSIENVKSAQSAYVTGKIPFVSLIEAQRSLVMQRDRSFEVSADYERRRATLDRLVGVMP